MASIKPNNYTEHEQQIYLFARALGHPARVRMIEMLKDSDYRNIDFSKKLHMAPSTIKHHIDKLKDADLVEIEYFIHYYSVSLNQLRLSKFLALIN